jgi:hypothetical protein
VEPPRRIDGALVLAWAWSKDGFGEVASADGSTSIAIHGLAVCQYEPGRTIYRFSCDARWECVQDAPYDSIEDAKAQLPTQYRAVEPTWVERHHGA